MKTLLLQAFDCVAHVINTVLRHTFTESKASAKITQLISEAKALVNFLKRRHLNNLLDKNVIQSCETRWNSKFLYLKTF